jgi:hypothetical protein
MRTIMKYMLMLYALDIAKINIYFLYMVNYRKIWL